MHFAGSPGVGCDLLNAVEEASAIGQGGERRPDGFRTVAFAETIEDVVGFGEDLIHAHIALIYRLLGHRIRDVVVP